MAQLLRGSPTNKGFASVQPKFPRDGDGDLFFDWTQQVEGLLKSSGGLITKEDTSRGGVRAIVWNFRGGTVKTKTGTNPPFGQVLIGTKHPSKRDLAKGFASLFNSPTDFTTSIDTPSTFIPSEAPDFNEPEIGPETGLEIDLEPIPEEEEILSPVARGFFSLKGFKSGRGFNIAPRSQSTLTPQEIAKKGFSIAPRLSN